MFCRSRAFISTILLRLIYSGIPPDVALANYFVAPANYFVAPANYFVVPAKAGTPLLFI